MAVSVQKVIIGAWFIPILIAAYSQYEYAQPILVSAASSSLFVNPISCSLARRTPIYCPASGELRLTARPRLYSMIL